MRSILLATAIIFAAPAAAQPQAICHPAAPPTRPVNSEDFNPGFGANTGLNDDFHDDISDPLDRPGTLISDLTREIAQNQDGGGVHLLQDFVGADCPKQ